MRKTNKLNFDILLVMRFKFFFTYMMQELAFKLEILGINIKRFTYTLYNKTGLFLDKVLTTVDETLNIYCFHFSKKYIFKLIIFHLSFFALYLIALFSLDYICPDHIYLFLYLRYLIIAGFIIYIYKKSEGKHFAIYLTWALNGFLIYCIWELSSEFALFFDLFNFSFIGEFNFSFVESAIVAYALCMDPLGLGEFFPDLNEDMPFTEYNGDPSGPSGGPSGPSGGPSGVHYPVYIDADALDEATDKYFESMSADNAPQYITEQAGFQNQNVLDIPRQDPDNSSVVNRTYNSYFGKDAHKHALPSQIADYPRPHHFANPWHIVNPQDALFNSSQDHAISSYPNLGGPYGEGSYSLNGSESQASNMGSQGTGQVLVRQQGFAEPQPTPGYSGELASYTTHTQPQSHNFTLQNTGQPLVRQQGFAEPQPTPGYSGEVASYTNHTQPQSHNFTLQNTGQQGPHWFGQYPNSVGHSAQGYPNQHSVDYSSQVAHNQGLQSPNIENSQGISSYSIGSLENNNNNNNNNNNQNVQWLQNTENILDQYGNIEMTNYNNNNNNNNNNNEVTDNVSSAQPTIDEICKKIIEQYKYNLARESGYNVYSQNFPPYLHLTSVELDVLHLHLCNLNKGYFLAPLNSNSTDFRMYSNNGGTHTSLRSSQYLIRDLGGIVPAESLVNPRTINLGNELEHKYYSLLQERQASGNRKLTVTLSDIGWVMGKLDVPKIKILDEVFNENPHLTNGPRRASCLVTPELIRQLKEYILHNI